MSARVLHSYRKLTDARYNGGGLFMLSGHVIDCVVKLLGRPKAVKSWPRHDSGVPDKLADNDIAVVEYEKALVVASLPESNPPGMRVNMRAAKGPYRVHCRP